MKKLSAVLFGLILTACAAQNYNPDVITLGETNYVKTISANEATRKSDGFKLVNVTGETYEDTDLYYRVIWFDDNGMKINSLLSKSVKASVRRDTPFNWVAVAPNAHAERYHVYVSDRVIEQ